MIKYKIKREIVDCEKIESVTSHDLYPPPSVKLSHFLRPPPPSGAWHTLWTAPKDFKHYQQLLGKNVRANSSGRQYIAVDMTILLDDPG